VRRFARFLNDIGVHTMRFICAFMLTGVLAAFAAAHFVYVVPAKDGQTLQVVFSDSLEPDEAVAIEKVTGLKLLARDENGQTTTVEHKTDKHSLTATVPAKSKLLFGTVTYGLMSRKDTKPALLVYHPKAVMAGCDAKLATIGDKAAIEIIPITHDGKTAFEVHAAGKPVPEVELSVLLPNGEKAKWKTDKSGKTEAIAASGRYAIWTKQTEAKSGEHDGKKYEEIRHYATLVVDVK